MPTRLLLSQPAPPENALGELAPWLILIGLLVVLLVVIIYIARRMINQPESSTTTPFTLHDLRELHKRGQLTDEEFARAKSAMIEQMMAADESDADDDQGDEKPRQPDKREPPEEPPNSHNGSPREA